MSICHRGYPYGGGFGGYPYGGYEFEFKWNNVSSFEYSRYNIFSSLLSYPGYGYGGGFGHHHHHHHGIFGGK